jgi:molecular chaperone DnaJ
MRFGLRTIHKYKFKYAYPSKLTNNYLKIHSHPFHTSSKLMSMDDLYSLLGVPKDATQEEIKQKYYKYAKMYHPDLPENRTNVDVQKKFQEISAAYDILGNEKKRKNYDNFGLHAGGEVNEEEIFGKMSQAMEEMMGKNEYFLRGLNVEVPIDLTFEEAALGTEKKIEYNVRVQCTKCLGLATIPGHFPILCKTCNGKGFTSSGKGVFLQRRACSTCSGNGSIITHPCTLCKGKGTIPKLKKLKVKIPAGVDTDHQVRLVDKGNEGDRRSGKTGTLFMLVNVKPHPIFKREKNNVHVDANITVSQAILGDTIKVHTLGGMVEMKVPSGIQPGEKRVLRGKGIHDDESIRAGDQFVHFKVVIPKSITKDQFELISQFSKSEKIAPYVQPRWKQYLGSIKSYFWK